MATSVSVKDVITDILDTGNTPMTLHQNVGSTSGVRVLTMHTTSNADYVVPVGRVFQCCYINIYADEDCIFNLTDSTVIDTLGTNILPEWYSTQGATLSINLSFPVYFSLAAGHNFVVALPSWAGDAMWTITGYERDV